MNINLFFVFIFTGLVMIYVFFNPTKLQQFETKEIAQLELFNFSIYDLDVKGLRSVFSGLKGYKYKDRYEVSDVNYTDNTKEYTTNIYSDFGIYKDHIINLQGDVVFVRADGLSFKTNEAFYDQDTGILKTPSAYTLYRNNDKITGVKLFFDSKENHVLSKQISATYQIQDNGK